MNHQNIFPVYTPRQAEEDKIRDLILDVQRDGVSRALLLYGDGGVGKSYLLRNLSRRLQLKEVVYVGPIDIDDSEYWSITNLSRHIAEGLGQGDYFQEYKNSLVKMPKIEKAKIGHETVLAHLRKTKDIFVEDYQDFIERSEFTSILIFDTIESIRGTDTLNRLLLWLKKLPQTVIVLAGRPIGNRNDPVERELDEHPKLDYRHLVLGKFSREESLRYLEESPVIEVLEEEEKERLALMSKGHPLWLALSIYYLSTIGIPEEVEQLDIKASETKWPYQNGALHDAYLRRLVIPYQESDFWHEAIFRLGIVRRRVSKDLWKQLMSDRALPLDIPTWDDAWQELLQFPWVRPRANSKYVTLQDVLAEELARRIIPYRDFEKEQRTAMWQKAIIDYSEQIVEQEIDIQRKKEVLDKVLADIRSEEIQAGLLNQVFDLDKESFDLFLLQTTQLYYLMLCDYKEGSHRFLELFKQADQHHQIRFMELLWAEIQRFLPGERVFDPLEDIIKLEIQSFHNWYQKHPEIQFEIITRAAKYLYEIGRPDQSVRLLNSLWDICQGNLEWEYHILHLRGNAGVRQPGYVKDAREDFEGALERTRNPKASTKLKLLEGEALTELGYYCRNTGDWHKAGDWYLEALRRTPLREDTVEELAVIQSQYAYVQALRGLYQDAHDLVDSALEIRQALAEPRFVGMALSVKGEVFRYERRFAQAWEVYDEAEKIFSTLNNWGWLGLVRQEMAICLFQAHQAEVVFPGHENVADMRSHARELAEDALDYCREYSRRSYPSALNRTGRILGIGFEDYEQGLKYLAEGIEEAKAMADGWFWFANLIEYTELCYKAWEAFKDEKYLGWIGEKGFEIKHVYQEYQFSDLRGRWKILQGQLKVQRALQNSGDEKFDLLNQALEHFTIGYPLIAFGYVGSHGASALGHEFDRLADVLRKLDIETRVQWFEYLDGAWSQRTESVSKDRQEASLLASLNRIYLKLQILPEKKRV